MKKLIFYIFLLSIIFSCTSEKENQYKQDILGEWVFTETKSKNSDEPASPFIFDAPNFICQKDGTYINKNGFFTFFEKKERWENKTLYLGEKTKFKISADSLSILNPITNKFESNKIIKLNKDSLLLEFKNKSFQLFISKKTKLKHNNLIFDEIIVSKSGCYGTCPENNTIVKANGEILFNGINFNLKEGFYKGCLSPKIFQEFQTQLNQMDLNSLEKNYSIDVTDLQTETITLISKGKIYKTISDYGNKSPFELRRLIRNISYLYQKDNLEKIIVKDPIFIYFFKSKNHRVSLIDDSEKFFLFDELSNAKVINNTNEKLPFVCNYLLERPEGFDYKDISLYEREVSTDGRIFKIQLRDKTYKTVDLGYNFFEKNNLIEPINN